MADKYSKQKNGSMRTGTWNVLEGKRICMEGIQVEFVQISIKRMIER